MICGCWQCTVGHPDGEVIPHPSPVPGPHPCPETPQVTYGNTKAPVNGANQAVESVYDFSPGEVVTRIAVSVTPKGPQALILHTNLRGEAIILGNNNTASYPPSEVTPICGDGLPILTYVRGSLRIENGALLVCKLTLGFEVRPFPPPSPPLPPSPPSPPFPPPPHHPSPPSPPSPPAPSAPPYPPPQPRESYVVAVIQLPCQVLSVEHNPILNAHLPNPRTPQQAPQPRCAMRDLSVRLPGTSGPTETPGWHQAAPPSPGGRQQRTNHVCSTATQLL